MKTNPHKFSWFRQQVTERGTVRVRVVGWAIASALLGLPSALAQVVERNLPPPVVRPAESAAANAGTTAEIDDTPIAGPLQALIFLSSGEVLIAPESTAVDATRVARLNNAAALQRLQPFLGRPISRRLIAEILAEAGRYYREIGFPFVSFSTPEQELTTGVLQVRVQEFRAGRVIVEGDAAGADHVRRHIRLQEGEAIDSRQLLEDIEWLNRYPFRRIQAKFAPGSEATDADLHLVVDELRPWRVYAGYANSGAPSTGRDRYFLSAVVGHLPLLRDAVFSYQATGSENAWQDSHPSYISHGARLYVPTLPGQNVDVSVSAVESNQSVSVFGIRQKTLEAAGSYRMVLRRFVPLPGEIFGGVEVKQQARDILFGDINIFQAEGDAYQGMVGWANTWSDPKGRSSLALALHFNPGGFGGDSSSQALREYTEGRVSNAQYAYLTLDYSRTFALPAATFLTTTLSGQFTTEPLPSSAQMGMGGEGFVRGYSGDDGSYDRGLVMRNEVRFPSRAPLSEWFRAKVRDQLSPFIFVDLGYAEDCAADEDEFFASAGVGTNYQVGRHTTAALAVAHLLKDGPTSRSGDWRAEIRVVLNF